MTLRGSTTKAPPFYTSPERWKPHGGQKKMMKFQVEHAAAAILADPGTGKTSATYGAFEFLRKRGLARTMLVIAPLNPARLVWPAEASKWEEFRHLRVELLHGPGKEDALGRDADVYVINPEGLEWLLEAKKKRTPAGKSRVVVDVDAFRAMGFDMLVIDECFPVGTMVRTPTGDRPIERLLVGDVVDTDVGPQLVTKVTKRRTTMLVRLEMEDGKTLTCTPNHPIFTDLGWLTAECCVDRRIYDPADMRRLWGDVRTTDGVREMEVSSPRDSARLLEVLCQSQELAGRPGKDVEGDRRGARGSSWEAELERREAVAGGLSSTVVEAQGRAWYKDIPGEPGRERPRADVPRDPVTAMSSDPFYLQLRGLVGEAAARLSYELQGRLRRYEHEDGDRSRRRKSPQPTSSGSEEGRSALGTRVDRVTHLEQHSGTDVWNISVGGARRYFAGGYLVHNCTMFKHTNSLRFKLLKAVHGTFRYRWGLTGTPAPNGLIDLFGQCYILDEGRTLGKFVTHFRSEYFVPGFDGTSWILQRGAETKIYDRLRPLALRLQAADYVDMPEVVEVPVRFDLPAAARKVYDALEDDLLANIDSGLVTAKNAAVASNKLRQVASGGVYLDEELEPFVPVGKRRGKRDVGELHDGKVSLLADLVDELQGSPLLVAYDFRHDLSRIRERFGDVPHIGGGVSTKRVSEIERAWNAGEIPLLAVHPQSASHGLNLQKSGNHVCWFTPTWDYERYEQLNRRVARQGAAFRRVFVHVLIARGTVDDRVFWKLRGKARTQSDLLDALLDGRRPVKKVKKS